MKNHYEIRGDITAIFIDSKTYGRVETIISTSDLPRAQEIPGRWGLTSVSYKGRKKKLYVQGRLVDEKGNVRTVKLHRWLLGITDPSIYVDHQNHDTLDNRRSNLCAVTSAENQQNITTQTNSTSGFLGVSWDKERNKWCAHIKVNRRKIYLGRFQDINDAILARQEAEQRYFHYKQKVKKGDRVC